MTQHWYAVCDGTAALPIPGIGVLVRYITHRFVDRADFRASEVPAGVSMVLIPGAALQPVTEGGKTTMQVVSAGGGNPEYVGEVWPCG